MTIIRNEVMDMREHVHYFSLIKGNYMRKYFSHGTKKKIAIVALAIIILCLLTSFFEDRNYTLLLDADAMNVYSGADLITTIDEPGYLIDTFQGSVGIGVVDLGQLGVRRFQMRELYKLEFIKNDKAISTITLLTPKNPDKVEKEKLEAWGELQGYYVVMYERFDYFRFGKNFYSALEKVLNDVA